MIEPDWQSEDGSVRLYCGDQAAITPDIEADACVTDPPYGINYSHGGSSGILAKTTKFVGIKVAGDERPFDPTPFLRFPSVVLWGANHYASKLPDSSRWLVWDKRDGVTSNDLADCEMAWTNSPRVARLFSHRWMGMLKASERGEPRVHPMQKPVAVMKWAIEQVEIADDAVVFDGYMGSGTTGVACVNTGRKFVGVEIDRSHFDVAVKRISAAIRAKSEQLAFA